MNLGGVPNPVDWNRLGIPEVCVWALAMLQAVDSLFHLDGLLGQSLAELPVEYVIICIHHEDDSVPFRPPRRQHFT